MKDVNANDLSNLTDPRGVCRTRVSQASQAAGELPQLPAGKVFNNDATLTSAVLDRLLHHAETITIEGRSYRMKDQIEEP
jgi:hypothetical protein